MILAEAQCHGSCNRKQKRSITHHWRNDARLVSSVGLALIGPAYLGANALWPLVVIALPLEVLGAVVGSLLAGPDVEHEKRFGEVMFQIQTGVRSSQS